MLTPVRNEEENLSEVAKNVISQNKRPQLWLIVDDHSIDRTKKIGNRLDRKYPFIKFVETDIDRGIYGFKHLNKLIQTETERLVKLCDKKDISWDYLALLGADHRIGENFYKDIIENFESDEVLGIASGTYYENGAKKTKNHPRGSLIFRRECFEDIGGYTNHIYSIKKAKQKGWKAKTLPPRLDNTRFVDSRKNYFDKGRHIYKLGINPFRIIMRSIYRGFRNPPEAVNVFAGYLSALINTEQGYEYVNREDYKKTPEEILKKVKKFAKSI